MEYEEARIDATATAYPTGKRIDLGARQAYEVGFWESKAGDRRVTGPVASTFPQMSGWQIGDTKVSVDKLSIKKMCEAETRKKFIPPSAVEQKWREIFPTIDIDFEKVWKMKWLAVSSRDRMTWIKVMHRTIFVAKHDPNSDGVCRACDEQENALHLCNCPVITDEYWDHVIELLTKLGMDPPEHTPAFIALGRIDSTNQIVNELAGIMALAWRCIYAEIVESRKTGSPLSTEKAHDRLISMVHSRTVAEASRWKKWVDKSLFQTKKETIPMKHWDKIIYTQEPMGEYQVAGTIQTALDEVKKKKQQRRNDRTHQ